MKVKGADAEMLPAPMSAAKGAIMDIGSAQTLIVSETQVVTLYDLDFNLAPWAASSDARQPEAGLLPGQLV